MNKLITLTLASLIPSFLFSQEEETSLCLDVGVSIHWETSLGRSYQLQRFDDSSGTWNDIAGAVTSMSQSQSYYDEQPIGSRSYRVAESREASSAGPSVLLNGGFEEGAGSEASDWSVRGGTAALRSNADAFNGAYSMHSNIQNVGNAPSSARFFQSITFPSGENIGGESYDFSFWAKEVRRGVSYVQHYEVQWIGVNNQVLGSSGIKSFSPEADTWVQINQDNLIAPAGSLSARVNFSFITGAVNGGLGEVFIDEVSLGRSPVSSSLNFISPTIEESSRISWQTVFGAPYQVHESDNLEDWVPYGAEIFGDGNLASVVIPVTGVKKFYRVGYLDTNCDLLFTDIVPLYSPETALEADLQLRTADALITHVADRARDRHARESQFQSYDHYLPWYWEDRSLNLEIIDRVAKGGNDITFNYTTQAPLGAPEFRAFFLGVNTVAEYHLNLLAPLVGPNQYSVTLNHKLPDFSPIAIGDQIEIEISQFLENPANGRSNYYGTTVLYVVGEGIVPWGGRGPLLDSYRLPEKAWLGGLTTLPYQYSDEPEHRFKQTAGNIAPASIQPFLHGRRLHHTDFSDGTHSESGNPVFSDHIGKLGPKFIGKSCVDCHVNNGRSLAPEVGEMMTQSVMRVGSDEQGSAHNILGSVLQPYNNAGVAEGGAMVSGYTELNGSYGDGTVYSLRQPEYSFNGVSPEYFSARVSSPLIGLGLLEAVCESVIISRADPDDVNGDGISGRIQTVVDPETGETRIGRFTSKAGKASVRHQIASALNFDMGVSSSVFPILDGDVAASPSEIGETELQQLTRYISVLGVSARRDLENTEALRGETLFLGAGCAACHTPSMVTSSYHPVAELRKQTIQPYTDLLLHDMGPALADNMGEGEATGAEWRTAPLWNIGLTAGVSGGESYLHDGRARTLEEAILWHGGEGEDAKENFRTMSAGDRAALIKFLKSL